MVLMTDGLMITVTARGTFLLLSACVMMLVLLQIHSTSFISRSDRERLWQQIQLETHRQLQDSHPLPDHQGALLEEIDVPPDYRGLADLMEDIGEPPPNNGIPIRDMLEKKHAYKTIGGGGFPIQIDLPKQEDGQMDAGADTWQQSDKASMQLSPYTTEAPPSFITMTYHPENRSRDKPPNHVALGCAITTKTTQTNPPGFDPIRDHPIFKYLLPSFCKTASSDYWYHFYISFDRNDNYLQASMGQQKFTETFNNKLKQLQCGNMTSLQFKRQIPETAVRFAVSLHLVRCEHNGSPAWAQSDAMFMAYLDGIQYFYRVNDDTWLLTRKWTESFIEALHNMPIPNMGVVGPNHKGGNSHILTYDFVHKTHFEIFGQYYPREFPTWYADMWITKVYENHMMKIPFIRLRHFVKETRYGVQTDTQRKTTPRLTEDRLTLMQYINAWLRRNATSTTDDTAPKRVIAVSLHSRVIKYAYGALRNAQMVRMALPGWTLRVYMQDGKQTGNSSVYARIVSRLLDLGAEIHLVHKHVPMAQELYHFLAADDVTLDVAVMRSAASRLTRRDVTLLQYWLQRNSTALNVRDHPMEALVSLSGRTWAARPRRLAAVLPNTIYNLSRHDDIGKYPDVFLEQLWDLTRDVTTTFDSVSCDDRAESEPFPTDVMLQRDGWETVGETYSAYGEHDPDERKVTALTPAKVQCGDVRVSSRQRTFFLLQLLAKQRAASLKRHPQVWTFGPVLNKMAKKLNDFLNSDLLQRILRGRL